MIAAPHSHSADAGAQHGMISLRVSPTMVKPAPIEPLALRPRDAARALGIGTSKLWRLTVPRGPVTAVKIGAAIVYRLEDLRAFLAAEAEKARQPQ